MTYPRLRACCGVLAAAASAVARADTIPIRVATYNVAADVNGGTTVNDAEISTVLGGIGSYNPDGLAHPLDLLALEETTSNATTVQPIANDLNALYNTSTYAVPALQPGESGNNPTTGNGPSSIVYNRATLQLLAAGTIGPANGSANGVYRQVARYEFEPAAALGGTAAGAFYVYVEHAKSGSTTADQTARGQEAALVRADANALPTGSRVVYVGDFNIGASTEQSIVNLESATPANGTGQAYDPINMPGNYALNNAFRGILTESATNLRYRDDLQLVTGNVLNNTSGPQTGLLYTPTSYTAFGNNGSVNEGGTVNSSSNTALPGLANRTAVLTALTQVTDHLPVVADYTDVVGTTTPTPTWAAAAGGSWGTAANWSPAAVPNAPGATVTFGPSIAAPATVTLDNSYVVGRLTFNSSTSYTIAAATNTLYLNDVGDPAGVAPSIAVLAGQHTIAAPLYLAGGVTITTAPGSSLTLATSVAGSGPVNVNGTLNFAANATASEVVRAVPGLVLSPGTTVTVAGSGSVLTTPFLTAPAGSVLNLGTNALTVANSSPAAVSALVAAGRITAAPDLAGLHALGVIANDDGTGTPLYGSAAPLGLFETTAPATGTVLVRYTYFGDANLDGHVDGSDYALIDAGYASGGSLTGWYNGDFNADGVVDASDYTLIDNAFNLQSPIAVPTAEVAVPTVEVAAAVPEPATLSLLAFAAAMPRRRLSRK